MERKTKVGVCAAMVLGFAVAMLGASPTVATQDRKAGKQTWSVDVPCPYYGELVQGVSVNGTLLLDEGCTYTEHGGTYVPHLVLRRVEDGSAVSHKVLQGWTNFVDARKDRLYDSFRSPSYAYGSASDPAFRFLRGPNAVLLIQVPWLAVVDLRSGSIVRSVLPSPDLTDPKSPALHIPISQPVPMVAAVSPDGEAIAVASNLGKRSRAFIFNSDLTKQTKSWALSRYVEDLVWSPDGKRIAVLYDGKFDAKGRYVGQFPWLMPVRFPDIAVFEAATGRELESFFTGGPEAEIAFSPDGSLIYSISEASNVATLQKDALRAFSPTTGKLVRIISPRNLHVHDEFAVSPDGRFIAANASTPLWHPFFTEPHYFGNVSRVAVLNAKTGKVLFRHSRRVADAVPLNPIFTPDGRMLIVQYGPARSAKGSQRYLVHIVAYSLAALHGG